MVLKSKRKKLNYTKSIEIKNNIKEHQLKNENNLSNKLYEIFSKKNKKKKTGKKKTANEFFTFTSTPLTFDKKIKLNKNLEDRKQDPINNKNKVNEFVFFNNSKREFFDEPNSSFLIYENKEKLESNIAYNEITKQKYDGKKTTKNDEIQILFSEKKLDNTNRNNKIKNESIIKSIYKNKEKKQNMIDNFKYDRNKKNLEKKDNELNKEYFTKNTKVQNLILKPFICKNVVNETCKKSLNRTELTSFKNKEFNSKRDNEKLSLLKSFLSTNKMKLENKMENEVQNEVQNKNLTKKISSFFKNRECLKFGNHKFFLKSTKYTFKQLVDFCSYGDDPINLLNKKTKIILVNL